MAKPGSDPVLSRRVDDLAGEVDLLRRRLEALERNPGAVPPDLDRGTAAEGAKAGLADRVKRSGPALGGVSSLFGRAATVCFLLVVALLLRTFADGRMLAIEQGVWLGVGYAGMLSGVGWVLFRRGAEQASTFCIIGTLLLAAVVLEGTLRHAVVPPVAAYGLLTALVVGTGFFLRDRAATWTLWGAGIAATGVGTALLAPRPLFAPAAVLVLALNGLGGRRFVSPGRLLLRAVAWLCFVTLWGYWGLELSAALRRPAPLPGYLSVDWFGWLLAGSLLYFVVCGILEIRGGVGRWSDAFDACLLPLVLGAGHLAGARVLGLAHGPVVWIGAGELAVAVLLFGVGEMLRGRPGLSRGPGLGLLAASGAALLVLGFPVALGGAASVVGWGIVALLLGRLSRRWRSGGVRAVSYLFPVAAAGYAWLAADLAPGGGREVLAGVCMWVAGGCSLAHYLWLRGHGAPGRSSFFTAVDPRDDTASIVLAAVAGLGLAAARVWLFLFLATWFAEPSTALSAATSVLWCLAAPGLIALGQRRGDPQVRTVGVLLMGGAGVKVFVFDLLAGHGVPLVLSVLAFGVAAGASALMLRRAVGEGVGLGHPDEFAPKLETGAEGE